jgi:hypothetical protein
MHKPFARLARPFALSKQVFERDKRQDGIPECAITNGGSCGLGRIIRDVE